MRFFFYLIIKISLSKCIPTIHPAVGRPVGLRLYRINLRATLSDFSIIGPTTVSIMSDLSRAIQLSNWPDQDVEAVLPPPGAGYKMPPPLELL